MNPFTETLIQELDRPDVAQYVSYWDRAEALVIRVYKAQSASGEDAHEWQVVRGWLLAQHPRWAAALAAYWPRTRIGLEPAKDDPFGWLLTDREAADFIGDWRAMQTLPAVREAINLWLVEQIEAKRSS